MGIKLGNTTASLYLGSTPVAAYLGTEQVYSAVQARTLYFNDAEEDSDWATLGNWWLNEGYTVPATSLPSAADSVIVNSGIGTALSISVNSGSPAAVANLTLNDPESIPIVFTIAITVTGAATINGAEFVGTLTGNATFNDSAIFAVGTINGNATFNDNSRFASGTVTGTATFNDSACYGNGTAGTFVPDPPPSCE